MYRILVVANRTGLNPELHERVRRLAAEHDDHTVLLLAPALTRRFAHLVSASDAAVAAAEQRATEAARRLSEMGLNARGTAGDPDPWHAIEDALDTFAADTVVISTCPPESSHWLERGLVEHAERELSVPVVHVMSGVSALISG